MGNKLIKKSERGQLSIFMGITLILIMGMLAFIINVGLFVKAKINLQNAVDAAAFSGAATQSRQLTNIAYANWELRNVYKEWMFKYYVLGQVGLFPTNFQNITGKGQIDFRLNVPGGLQFNAGSATNSVAVDAYNAPSICIHNNTSRNICPLYMVPGLPRFPAIGVAGITEIHEALVNKLVSEKATDCSSRSNINYLAAISWIYGSGIKEIPGAPLIASNRPGAWPQALELAMRIRNLEMIVNRPPITNGMAINDARQLPVVANDIALNERPYKAFMSAFRNLSGGKYKESGMDELVNNFKLYEIAPQPFQASTSSTSGFLIPDDFVYPGAESFKATTKHYLDLQVMPVNLAVFYSTFTSTKYKYEGVDAEASCGISKTALPVPGYILGYTKNPEVITYYAVRGESKFIGLFFPFIGELSGGIKLSAYAAAKPFGGRIGPRLFQFGDNGSTLLARQDRERKSKPYVSGLITPPPGTPFKTGYPIPYVDTFWASNAKNNFVLGGVPGTNSTPSFGIPNIVYDFEDEGDLTAQSTSTQVIQDIAFNTAGTPPAETLGLYNRVQFRALKNSLGTTPAGTTITSAQITEALIRSRRATKYDALNYLIPDFRENGSLPNNVPPYILKANSTNTNPNIISYALFAPLTGANTLYKTQNAVVTVINQYIQTSTDAVNKYLQSLLEVSNSILNTGGPSNLMQESAKSIHVNAGSASFDPAPLVEGSCATDIASKFAHFFKRKNTACGIVPLENLMVEYIDKNSNASSPNRSDIFFVTDYFIPGGNPIDGITPMNLYTGFFPGKRQGSNGDDVGTVNHPFSVNGDSYSGRRNFYSTKFVQLAKLIEGPPSTKGNSTTGIIEYASTPALKESLTQSPEDLIGGLITIKNGIRYDATSGINNPYYLDF